MCVVIGDRTKCVWIVCEGCVGEVSEENLQEFIFCTVWIPGEVIITLGQSPCQPL